MNPKPAQIRAARKRAGLTQTKAARLIYHTLPSWQRWEYGNRPMNPALWELFTYKVHSTSPKTSKT